MAIFFHGTKAYHLVNGSLKHVPKKDTGDCYLDLGHDLSWHPYLKDGFEVQADGDELDFILRHFKNIRQCTASVQRWTGDDAKFIIDHIANVKD